MGDLELRVRRPRSHHVGFRAYVLLLMALYSFFSLTNFLPSLVDEYRTAYLRAYPDHPPWYLPLLATCQALNVACLVIVLRWRRWGVYVFALSSLTICAVAWLVHDLLAVSSAVALILLLFFLWLGSPRSTWSQLD